MKTTVIIGDSIGRQLKREAAQRGTTMSQLIEAALRLYFAKPTNRDSLPPIPTFSMGKAAFDYADRDAIERTLGEK